MDSKKAEAHHHLINFVISFLLGALVMYLIAKGVISIPLEVCPVAP